MFGAWLTKGLHGFLQLLNGSKAEMHIHQIHEALAIGDVRLKQHCQPNSVFLLWRSLPKLKWGFIHTSGGKTAHIYVNYCRGRKCPILKKERCVPGAVRVKYLVSLWSLVVTAHLKSVSPHFLVMVAAVIVPRRRHHNARIEHEYCYC